MNSKDGGTNFLTIFLRTAPIQATEQEKAGLGASKALEGIPILGAYVPQAGAAISALAHPLTGVGAEGTTIGERYSKNLERERALSSAAIGQEN